MRELSLVDVEKVNGGFLVAGAVGGALIGGIGAAAAGHSAGAIIGSAVLGGVGGFFGGLGGAAMVGSAGQAMFFSMGVGVSSISFGFGSGSGMYHKFPANNR